MALRSLLCIPLGHRWTPDEETTDPTLVLRCKRCGKRSSGIKGMVTLHDKLEARGSFGTKRTRP